MTMLFIVRHGNTFEPGEPPRRIGRRTDLPLVQTGRHQAEVLGEWFRRMDVRFSRVLAADLIRARTTAAIIIARQPQPVAITPAAWLNEIDHGPDEDQLEASVLARLGAAALNAWDRWAVPPDGWVTDSRARIAAWAKVFDCCGPGDVLAVTSGGAARFALLALPDGQRLPSSLKLRTGAMGQIAANGHGTARLVCWDRRPPV